MPAQADIQFPCPRPLDSRFRGNDTRRQVLAVYVRNGHLETVYRALCMFRARPPIDTACDLRQTAVHCTHWLQRCSEGKDRYMDAPAGVLRH